MAKFEEFKSKLEAEFEKLRHLEKGGKREGMESFFLFFLPIFSDRSKCMTNRRQLESQLTENSLVKEVGKMGKTNE